MKFKRPLMLGSLFLIVIVLVSELIVHITQIQTNIPTAASDTPTTASNTPTAASNTPTAASNTPSDGYGIYDSCSLSALATCLSNLDDMAAAGFKLVINYGELRGNANAQRAYLNHAQSVGMKVIVALNNSDLYNGADLSSDFPDLVQTCNCEDNHGFIQYV